MIGNNEEERFSGRRHANHCPEAALTALTGMGIGPERIFAWLGTFDYPLLASNGLRAALEELPSGWRLLTQDPNSGFDRDKFQEGLQAASRLGRLFGSCTDRPRPDRALLVIARSSNACNPHTRDLINERVKYREPIRPRR